MSVVCLQRSTSGARKLLFPSKFPHAAPATPHDEPAGWSAGRLILLILILPFRIQYHTSGSRWIRAAAHGGGGKEQARRRRQEWPRCRRSLSFWRCYWQLPRYLRRSAGQATWAPSAPGRPARRLRFPGGSTNAPVLPVPVILGARRVASMAHPASVPAAAACACA